MPTCARTPSDALESRQSHAQRRRLQFFIKEFFLCKSPLFSLLLHIEIELVPKILRSFRRKKASPYYISSQKKKDTTTMRRTQNGTRGCFWSLGKTSRLALCGRCVLRGQRGSCATRARTHSPSRRALPATTRERERERERERRRLGKESLIVWFLTFENSNKVRF